jgi:hypothetical protein
LNLGRLKEIFKRVSEKKFWKNQYWKEILSIFLAQALIGADESAVLKGSIPIYAKTFSSGQATRAATAIRQAGWPPHKNTISALIRMHPFLSRMALT